MKIIGHYKNQSVDVENWLIKKGFKKNHGGYKHYGNIKIKGRYFTLWHMYTGKKAYIIAEEYAGEFDIIVIALDDISTPEAVKYFLETGKRPIFEDWDSYTTNTESI